MRATFTGRESVTSTSTSFHFEPERPLAFTAGQFIELTLPGVQAPMHQFTISSSPHEPLVTITTSASDSDFKQALFALEPGASVHLSEPLGDFVLPLLLQTPLVFIAGGLGITPFHSIADWLHHTHEQRPARLFYSVSTEDDLMFLNTFDTAKIPVTAVVTHPSNAWGGARGELTGQTILGIDEPAPETLFYIAGSESFVAHLKKELTNLGVQHHQLVLDEFLGYR